MPLSPHHRLHQAPNCPHHAALKQVLISVLCFPNQRPKQSQSSQLELSSVPSRVKAAPSPVQPQPLLSAEVSLLGILV